MNSEKNPDLEPTPQTSNQPGEAWLEASLEGNPLPPPADTDPLDEADLFGADPDARPQGPASFVGKIPPGEDSSVPLADLPPVAATTPASDWLDSSLGLPKTEPSSVPPIPTSTSDIFSGPFSTAHGGSDVINGLTSKSGSRSGSSIFTGAPVGSDRFSSSVDDGQEPSVSEPPSDANALHEQLFGPGDSDDQLPEPDSAALEPDEQQMQQLFKTPIPPKQLQRTALDEHQDFDQVTEGSSSSNLFEDAIDIEGSPEDHGVLGSAVNLADPDELSALAGPSSSIFSADLENLTPHVDLDEIPIMASNDEASDAMRFSLEQDDNNSSIFDSGKKHSDPESVFEEVVESASQDPLAKAEAEAGAIDWQLPGQGNPDQVSQRMTVDDDGFEVAPDAEDLLNSPGLALPAKATQPLETDWDALADGLPAEFEPQATQDAFHRGELGEELPPLVETPAPLSGTAGIPFQAAAIPAEPKKIAKATRPLTKPTANLDDEDDDTPRHRPAPQRGSSRLGSWLGGSALGLLLGVGGSTGVYYSGLLSSSDDLNKPIVKQQSAAPISTATPNPPTTPPPVTTPSVSPRELLAAGEPARALKALEALGEAAPPVAKADRGQARWLNRLRELAATPTKLTTADEQFKLAEADLQAVVNAADQLQTAEEQQAGIRAALHLGLLKEVTGDVAAAKKIYSEALIKFPSAAQVFKTALERMNLTQPTSEQQSRLMPLDAADLAQAVALTLHLLQAEGEAKKGVEDEPGFLFWEAANLAAAGKLPEALAKLSAAKKLHEQRRLALAGKGTNPLSDPLEQIFSRSCTELAEFWKLKQELYTHPKYGAAFAKQGVSSTLTALDKQTEAATSAKATLESELKAAKDLADQLAADRLKAMKQLDSVTMDLLAAQEQVKKADGQLKKAEESLAAVIKELKVNKLVGEADDTPTVLSKLPAVLKEASAAASSADVKKAAEALLLAKKERDAAQQQAKTALASAQQAQAQAKEALDQLAQAKSDAEKQIKRVQDSVGEEIKKAVMAAQLNNLKAIQDLTQAANAAKAELTKQQREFQARLEQFQREAQRTITEKEAELTKQLQLKEQQHQQALADVRAGATVPLTSAELVARERGAAAFSRGVDFYFASQLIAAEASFALATSLDPADARYWYFLGLTRTLLNRPEPAEAAFKRGAEQERRGLPSGQAIDDSLERVQGTLRQTLNQYRPR